MRLYLERWVRMFSNVLLKILRPLLVLILITGSLYAGWVIMESSNQFLRYYTAHNFSRKFVDKANQEWIVV
jgi:hypothetical protein